MQELFDSYFLRKARKKRCRFYTNEIFELFELFKNVRNLEKSRFLRILCQRDGFTKQKPKYNIQKDVINVSTIYCVYAVRNETNERIDTIDKDIDLYTLGWYDIVYQSVQGGICMLNYNVDSYERMLGNINEKAIVSAASCMSQCTGCKCSCKCSCSVIMTEGLDWEEM